jgi:hypothetical protein
MKYHSKNSLLLEQDQNKEKSILDDDFYDDDSEGDEPTQKTNQQRRRKPRENSTTKAHTPHVLHMLYITSSLLPSLLNLRSRLFSLSLPFESTKSSSHSSTHPIHVSAFSSHGTSIIKASSFRLLISQIYPGWSFSF